MSSRSIVRTGRLPYGGRFPWAAARRSAAVAALLALCLSAATATAAAASAGPRVSRPVGRLYDDLSVAWWKYVLAQPASTNPLVDETGANCANGQSGDVFFLVGVNGSGSATRDECVVPRRRFLFFPLLNAFDVHTPGDGLDTPELVLSDFLTFNFRADSLRASVDGVPVGDLDPATTPYGTCAAQPASGAARTRSRLAARGTSARSRPRRRRTSPTTCASAARGTTTGRPPPVAPAGDDRRA